MAAACASSAPVFVDRLKALVKAYGDDDAFHKEIQDISDADAKHASEAKLSTLYGEVLPTGVREGCMQLCGPNATVLFDIGSGRGKFALQTFLECEQFEYVTGVELTKSRHKVASDAAVSLAKSQEGWSFDVSSDILTRVFCTSASSGKVRVLELRCGNAFAAPDLEQADAVWFNVDVPRDSRPTQDAAVAMLLRLRVGARVASYKSIETLFYAHADKAFASHFKRRDPICVQTSWSKGKTFAFSGAERIAEIPGITCPRCGNVHD
jgi:hypothetical protein